MVAVQEVKGSNPFGNTTGQAEGLGRAAKATLSSPSLIGALLYCAIVSASGRLIATDAGCIP